MTPWIDLAGWTLVHSVWQGTLIALSAAIALRLLRAATAQSRYAVACAALTAMLAAPAVTAYLIADAPARGARATATITAPGISPASVLPAPAARPGPGAARMTTTPSPASAPLWFENMLPAVVMIWLSGVAILLLRLVGGGWRVRRLHRAAFDEPVSRWQAVADRIARRLRLSRPVFIVDSARVATPTVIGWIRPVILLPLAAMANLAPAQIEAILAHELAHIRRHDFLVNLLQAAAETLLFYHPATWWLSSRVRAEREHCCDDVAVEICGDAVAYAAALTEIAAWHVAEPPLAMAATGGSLIGRVRRLLNVPADGTPRSSSGLLLCAAAAAVLVVAVSAHAVAIAQPPDGAPPDSYPRFGPPEVNEFLGFELFPMPKPWAIDDPVNAKAWSVTIDYATGEMPLVGFSGRSLIRHAYGLHGLPIIGAPRWLDAETFELSIASSLPSSPGVSDPEGLQTTLRQLLEQQLGLVVRREQREFPAYALVTVDRWSPSPRIRPTAGDCFGGPPRREPQIQRLRARGAPRFCGIETMFTGIEGRNVTIQEFAAEMGRTPFRPDRPIVDQTGLDGRYDFRITLGPLPLAAIGYGHPSLGHLMAPLGIRNPFTALSEQLGLRLVETTAPFDVLVIERINRPA